MATSGERSGSGSVGSAASAANVLTGFQSFITTAAATTMITVPAGRTWIGTVSVSVDCTVTAGSVSTGQSTGVVSISGAGATPAAGNVFQVSCRGGPNAAGGTTGSSGANSGATPLQVTAPAGNSVAIQVTSTIGGTLGDLSCTAVGALQ